MRRRDGKDTGGKRRRRTWPWAWAVGAGLVFGWFVLDKYGYDAVRGTRGQGVLDAVYPVAMWPADTAWALLERSGWVPLGDFLYDYLLYRGIQGAWLLLLSALAGIAVWMLLRVVRRKG